MRQDTSALSAREKENVLWRKEAGGVPSSGRHTETIESHVRRS